MAKKKNPYDEGAWIAVPLVGGGYAVGRIARVGRSARGRRNGILLGYFFGPGYDALPPAEAYRDATPEEAIWLGMFDDRGLRFETWVVLGGEEGFSRERWPLPPFHGGMDPGPYWIETYGEDLVTQTSYTDRLPREVALAYPVNGLAGYVAVELKLTRLLRPEALEREDQREQAPAHARTSTPSAEVAEVEPMAPDAFWRHIAAVRRGSGDDCALIAERLTNRLARSSRAEIQAFDRRWRELMAQAYTWPLWGAAYLINGGCSDDGFAYFRGWLLAQGEAVFTAALQDPDSLAAVVTPDTVAECEEILYAASVAYEMKTGAALSTADLAPSAPQGRQWQEENLPAMFPRLWAIFGSDEEESEG